MFNNKNKKIKKLVYVELNHSYISYLIEDTKDIKSIRLDISNLTDKKDIIKLWAKTIQENLVDLDFDIKLILLIKSNEFLIKNTHGKMSTDEAFEFFANKLALDKDEIELKQIKTQSYLIVKNEYLKDILYTFKEYEIQAIYDTSTLGSFQFQYTPNSIYMDISLNNLDLILNKNIVQKRSFKINLSTLINNCAKHLYTDFDTSLQNLKTGFRDIKSYKELEDSSKPVESEIKSFIDTISQNISTTLSFFSIYDNISMIDKIYINGDILEYDFLIHILSDKLNVKFIPVTSQLEVSNVLQTNINMFINLEKDIIKANKLRLDGINFKEGKDEFIFIENRFVSSKNLNKKQKVKLNSIQKVRVENKKNLEQKKQFNKSILKMDMKELYEFISYKLRHLSKGNERKEYLDTDDKSIYVGIFFALLTLVSLYFSFIYISEAENEYDLQVSNLENRITRVDKLKNDLGLKNKNILLLNDDLNKIFWTQKIITLADSMPNEIWLSSINLENIKKQVEKKEVTSKVLVLEARALPSSHGHVASIANYMQKLIDSNEEFKKDFIDIRFGGAEIINEYGYDVINFKLFCNFKKNVNIKTIEENKVQDNSIGTNIQNIGKYKQEQMQLLNTLGK